jgi:transcriptional regulator with XRE-family HTH domain
MIAERLTQAIRDTGLTQREVSRATGVDETLVSRFMRGLREPSFATLDRLLDALELEVVVRPRRGARKDG